jgi:serine/threonine protein phosphatase 1
MATFAIGDIHGNDAALEDLLAQLAPLLHADDVIVFLGDYIDRGPATKGCIDRILQLQERNPATVVTLLGNHEYSLLQTHRDFTRHSWLIAMDAWATIESYSRSAAAVLRREAKMPGGPLYKGEHHLPYDLFFDALPPAHLAFLQGLKPYHRTADALCIHAGIDLDHGAVEAQSEKLLVWGTHRFPDRYHGPELVVYGHLSNAVLDKDGWPRPVIEDNRIGIDTIKHGVLTAIQLPERRVFQSARYGEPQEEGWIY